MKVIKPVQITPDNLVYSSVAENEYPAWASDADYLVGERVILDHIVYESVQTPNISRLPDWEPLYWSLVGPSNRYAMFDNEVSTVTSASEILEVTIAPGMVDSIALLAMDGAHIEITVRDGPGGEELFFHEQSLDGSTVYDWLQYFYQPFIPVHEMTLGGLPQYGNANINVKITSDGVVNVGTMVVGASTFLGDLEMGASIGILSFSKKETNPTTGTTRFSKRRNSKRMTGRMMVDNFTLNNLYRVLADLDATPCVWVGTDDQGYEPLTIYGFYRDFSIDVAYPTKSYCSLEIEGLA